MKELDLTKGSVPKVLMQFAVPYLIANVLQALYGGADLFVVGQYDDAASVAGVATGSQVMQTITGIIHSEPDGGDSLRFRRCRRKDNSLRHAPSDCHCIGYGGDDRTQLRGWPYQQDERLPEGRHWNGPDIRRQHLRLLPVPA